MRWKDWNTTPIFPRRNRASASSSIAVRSCPKASTLPPVARSNPPISMRSDDLPDPDGPISPTVSPFSMVSEMPFRMSTGPALPARVSRASVSARTGSVILKALRVIASGGYGALRAVRNAAVAVLALSSSVFAEPVTIVALGDSLTAGYGLADQNDGLVPQLEAWLKAKGRRCGGAERGRLGRYDRRGALAGGLGAGARRGRDDRDAGGQRPLARA
jgi:hypothetical protein